MSRNKDYDGPGEYEVTVHMSGSCTVTVHAESMADAEKKAEREADYLDCDFDAEADEAICVSPDPTTGLNGSCDSLERLNGIEMAVWAFTGKVPPEAMERLREEDRELALVGDAE